MADKKKKIPLSTRGSLNTSDPIGALPPGTLVEAKDTAHRFLGPKVGSKAFTRIWESQGTGALYGRVIVDGTDCYAQGYVPNAMLGLQWTLDLWFRLEDLAYAAGQQTIGVYYVYANNGGIFVSIRGPGHADHEKVHVELSTVTAAGVFGSRTITTCATRLTAGTTQTDKYHVRVVRDGASVVIYLNGVQDGSMTVSATQYVTTAPGGFTAYLYTSVAYADDNSTLLVASKVFKGRIYGAWLRDGAFSTQPIEARMPCGPWAPNVHHAYLGRTYLVSTPTPVFDAGRLGAHAKLFGTGWASNASAAFRDDDAPAPSPVQGVASWTTVSNRTATSVMCGGLLSTSVVG